MNQTDKELRKYGKKVEGGYMLTTKDLQTYFNKRRKKMKAKAVESKSFTIRTKGNDSSFCKMMTFVAVDENGKEIFGAEATLSQSKDIINNKWEDWKISFGTGGSDTYEGKLPHVTVINEAMKELKKLNRR